MRPFWYNLPDLSSVGLQLGVRSRETMVARTGWRDVWPLLAPCGLLLAGALIGYPFSLNAAVAAERLVGLAVVSLLAVVAFGGLRRTEQPAKLLIVASVVALLGAVWVISATGSDVFRGAVGTVLVALFRPVFGLARVTDSVEVTNTRFIVGYNGLADLCLIVVFCCGALLRSPRRWRTASQLALLSAIAMSLMLLVGTGARGGLTGLAAGICAIGLYAWPRRYAILATIAAPLALIAATLGVFDKGLEFSSTAGRLTYWGDLLRLLVEYPLTGVGLGIDTANRVAVAYEINPDPIRIFYAHNTFVQSYLEQGPLGVVGMLLAPLIAVMVATLARRNGVAVGRRALLIAGLGAVAGLTAHGLTDQVVTTNVGTGMLLLGLASALAASTPAALAAVAQLTLRLVLATALVLLVVLVGLAATPLGRAQVLLNLGGLQLNQALAANPLAVGRSQSLADAENALTLGLAQDSGHPAILRTLARVRSTRFDDSGALDALRQAAQSNRLDAFDMLQIAHLYRDFGFVDEAYTWAARAYATWGRLPQDAVMQVYARSTLALLDDDRARTLADQAETAMGWSRFGEAHGLFVQALMFEPGNAYLQDRVAAAQRAVAKYGPGEPSGGP